jgi:hypothetical protein
VKRRRAREHDQDVAREQADQRREELLARLRGDQAAPSELPSEPGTAAGEAQPEPAAAEEPPVDDQEDAQPEA